MAYDFTRVNSRSMESTTPITAIPLTMAVWLYLRSVDPSAGVVTAPLSIGIKNSAQRLQITIGNTLTSSLQTLGLTTGPGGAVSGTATLINQWQHHCGVVTSTTSRTYYKDGAGVTNTNTAGTFSAFDYITIGGRYLNGVIGAFVDGIIAEAAFWNVALTAAEVNSLARGISCIKIRPQNLVFYAPLIRDLQDTKGGLIITPNNGPIVAAHPRIYK